MTSRLERPHNEYAPSFDRSLAPHIPHVPRVPRWVRWLIAAASIASAVVVVVGSTSHAFGNVETRTHAESTFVRRDSLASYQAVQALQHQRDSLVQDAHNVRVESILDELLRGCKRRGDCR